MAPFDNARARKMNDEEESFLDWEGEATLFEDDEAEDEEDDTEEASAALDEEEDDDAYDDEDDEIEELDFG
ncbi:hypothetical protein [Vulgatibacter sp.]|uniref:hypothetical protein n=1 Tax=Vulgatibacter sp. TaxID=1971226 RepID=UPI003566C21A